MLVDKMLLLCHVGIISERLSPVRLAENQSLTREVSLDERVNGRRTKMMHMERGWEIAQQGRDGV